jgi:hypothetical protein
LKFLEKNDNKNFLVVYKLKKLELFAQSFFEDTPSLTQPSKELIIILYRIFKSCI